MKPTLLALAALLALSLPGDATTFNTQLLGYTDVNGNGQLDCGEPVRIGVFYQTDPPTSPTVDGTLHAIITLPDVTDTRGLSYLSGTIQTDNTFTTGCYGVVLQGNATSPADTHARVEVTCSKDPVALPGGSTILLTYSALYLSLGSPSFTSTADLLFDSATHLHASQTRPAATACTSTPPAVTIQKTAMSPTATPGNVLIYNLAITNASGLPLGGEYARETVPDNTTWDAANSAPGWFCTNSGAAGSACSYLFSQLPSGTTNIPFAVRVANPLAPGVASISNVACVAQSQTVQGCDSTSTPAGGSPVLTLTKQIIGGTPAAPGTVVNFSITVRNSGPRGSSDVVVTDTLPAGLTFSSSGSSAWSCSGSTCSADLGSLASGETKSLAINLQAPNPLPAGSAGTFNNTACASAVEGGSPSCGSAAFTVTAAPLINIAKTLAQGDGSPGSNLVYAIAVRNDGNQDAAGITITETYPSHTSPNLSASDPGWTCSGSSCTFALASLAAGQARSIAFAVTIESPLAAGVQTFTNAACSSSSSTPTACSTIGTPSNGHVALTLTKTLAAPVPGALTTRKVFSGDLVVYSITLANTGDQDAAGLTITETVPANTTYDAAHSDPAWSCTSTAAGSPCTLAVATLPAGSSKSFRYAVLVGTLPPGVWTVSNTACAADNANHTSCGSVDTPPNAPASLAVDLAATLATDVDLSGSVTAGDVLLYTATITNTGTTTAGAAVFTINSPDHTHLVAGSVTTSAGSISTGNAPADASIQVALGDLPQGSSATVTYRVTLAASLPDTVTQIVSQGSIAASNAAAALSNDPATPAPLDPTITPVTRAATPPPPPQNVPTLNEAGLILLAVLLAFAGVFVGRRRRTAK
jgi:uncharacterized repeat protein (TIGR01451 family)